VDNRTGDRLLHWFGRLRIRRAIRDEIHEAFMAAPPPSSAGGTSSADHLLALLSA
jgi:hypothetical protein